MDPEKSDARPPRRIACVRCRRRKKRCDRAVPSCSECIKTGSECVQVGVKTHGHMTTVPTAYLQQLESQMAALQQRGRRLDDIVNGTTDASDIQDEESSYPSPFDNSRDNSGHNDDTTSGTDLQDHNTSNMMPFVNADDDDASTSNIYSPSHSTSAPQAPTSADESSQSLHDMASIDVDWMDHYAVIYFRHAQPQWSFLNENDWHAHYRAWITSTQRLDDAQVFILLLVLAIGALLSSSYRRDCPHLMHASRLYETAIQRYLGSVTQHQSPLRRTQASLLMVIYSWHDSFHSILPSSIMLVLLNCQNLIDEMIADDEDSALADTSSIPYLRRQCVMSCHIVNEVVSSAWSYPQSFMFETLDNRMFKYASKMKVELNGSNFYDRLFQLRCIQSKIRHTDKKLQRLDLSDPFRNSCRLRLKAELQDWKASVQAFTSSTSPDKVVYHEPQSLLKLYDYGLSILMQENLPIMLVEDVGQLIECCSEACRTFRLSQQSNPLVYWTWTALMYQFRLGIMLLYCYLVTPRTMQTPVFSFETTLDGISSCRQTLEGFSARWPKSLVYLQTFQLLADKTFDGFYAETTTNSTALESPVALTRCLTSGSSREWTTTMEAMITELKFQHVHQAVVALIQDMIDRSSAENFNIEAMEFAPNLPLDSLDLFGFCVPT